MTWRSEEKAWWVMVERLSGVWVVWVVCGRLIMQEV